MKYYKVGSLVTGSFPSIHYTGSVSGMIKQGFWRKGDKIVRSGSYIYNLSKPIGGKFIPGFIPNYR